MLIKPQFDQCGNVEVQDPRAGELGRRDFLFRMGRGIGGTALSYMLARDGLLAKGTSAGNPLAPKAPHFAPKAKACIFLFMGGAPS
ncbi:MAG: hypothetical protein OXG96_13185, partial [Acidobacteria bacterium]|nr:hypothetical protein [Acidobacteriota bacterium]